VWRILFRASADFPFGSLWLPTAMSFDKIPIGCLEKDFSPRRAHVTFFWGGDEIKVGAGKPLTASGGFVLKGQPDRLSRSLDIVVARLQLVSKKTPQILKTHFYLVHPFWGGGFRFFILF
jgi:hypothetical protein